MKPVIVVHYGELALKGGNRPLFERALERSIRAHCPGLKADALKRRYGRFVLYASQPEVAQKLGQVFGLAYALVGYEVDAELEAIKKTAKKVVQGMKPDSFAVRVKRADKKFPLTSEETAKEVGRFLGPILNTPVELKSPALVVWVEIFEGKAFVAAERIEGPGGLPAGISGKAVALLSSGIDSPVASWQIAKRGAEVIFVHFHSFPFTNAASIENTKELVTVLKRWQPNSTLYLVPFGEIQKELIKTCPASYRVIIYRRVMTRIAERIAQDVGAEALVSGENLGQVASQTLPNMQLIQDAVSMQILRPLVGLDKREIIDAAKRIETYEISIRPYEDCCTVFVPAHPVTKGRAQEVASIERSFDFEKLIEAGLKDAEILHL